MNASAIGLTPMTSLKSNASPKATNNAKMCISNAISSSVFQQLDINARIKILSQHINAMKLCVNQSA